MTRAAVAVALAGALAVAGCGGGGDSADTAPEPAETVTTTTGGAREQVRTLALKSQLSRRTRRGGTAAGSQILLTGMLFQSKGGSAIGRSQGACTSAAPGGGEVYQCLFSFVLRTGVIYGQSMSGSDGPAMGVVTGGTGRYADVRGTFRYKATGSPRVDLTFKLRS